MDICLEGRGKVGGRMNNILIVKYIGQFAPYYYLGISGYTESFPERGDRILFYDEHTGNVYEETLSTDELFILDTWRGEPVVLLQDIEEKLEIARIVYETLMRGGVRIEDE